MRIAYNPKTAQALMSAPNNEDITFDLSGLAIYVKGVKFEGKAYSVFKKHTLNTTGGYDGLVPAPSYTETTERYLREDGTWVVPNNTTANLADYVTVNTAQTIKGQKRFTSTVKVEVNGGISLDLVSKDKYSGIAFVCNNDSDTLTKLNGFFLYKGDSNYYLTDSNWMHEYKILHSGNSSIKDGVITINNTSITPLTSHQSLTNYVTLNGDQTITGRKTFNNSIVMGTSRYIYGIDEAGGSMLHFDGERTVIGSSGASTTKSPMIRTNTGDVTINGDKTVLHSKNSYIKNGVITINGSSITPLTVHLSLSNYVTLDGDQTISGIKTFSSQLKFTVAKGTSPFTVSSTTKVDNLNADLLDGLHSTDFVRQYGIVGANFSTGNWLGYTYATEEHGGPVAGGVISAGVSSGMLLVGSHTGTRLYYRGVDDGAFSDWKRVAFTDSDITGNAASADKVNNSLTLKINSGTMEGTDLYTYNGSAAKTLDIKWGTGIKFVNTEGSLQIYNSGVRSISTGTTNGTIRVNTDGTSTNIPVKGLDTAAYINKNLLANYTKGNNYIAFNLYDSSLHSVGLGEGYIEYYDNGAWYNSRWGWVEAIDGFKGSLTGNAETATKLQTARTLTIGNSAKTFDGSADVTWNLHDILYHGTNNSHIGSNTSWDIFDPGIYYVASTSKFTGTNNPEETNGGLNPYRYGQLIVSRAGDGGIAQFYISHHDSLNNKQYGIKFRTGWKNAYLSTWNSLLDSSNYTIYTVKKDGTGASGDWNINSATATKLSTSRKIWGLNFDGSADVNGNIKMGSSGAGLHYQAKSGDWSYFPFFLHNSADSAVLFRATFVGKDESLSYFSLGPTLGSFTITNKSLVGIGTTSPTEKLHVNGLVNIEANSGILTIGCLNASYTHYITTGGTHWFNKAVEVHGSLTPHVNGSFDIGSTGKRWSTIYGVNGNFSGTIKMYTGDSALAIYSGRITDARSDGNICFLTSIDNTDPQSHAHPTQHGGRCNIVLQPRGGLVYIGTNPDGGDATYKLYVNGRAFSKALDIDSGSDAKIILNNTDAETKHQYISFRQDGTLYGYLGTFGDNTLKWSGNTILHSGNSSVSKSGQTLTVKINGVELSLTNTTYSSLKNPNAIKFKKTDGTTVTYDGSSAADLTAGVNYASSSNTTAQLSNTSIDSGTNPSAAASGQYVKWYSQISHSSGYAGNNYGFPVSNNANGILWMGTHSGPYGGLLGISSNGRIYYRFITNNSFPTTANGGSWYKVAWTSDIPTKVSQLTNDSGYLTSANLSNYVTLNTALTISGVKTFSTLLKFTVAKGTAPFTVSSTTKVDNLNADLLDGKHANDFYEKTAADGKFILFSKVSKSTVEGTNNAPHLFNIENENLITGYKSYWYVFNMGAYSGGNYRTQMAMPYLDSLTDSELFIRSSDKAGSWRTWRRVLHTGNSAVSGGGSSGGSSITVNIGGTSKTLTIPTSLPANGGNADTVDGYHAGLANGSVAIYVPFPTYTTLKTGGYISSSYGADEYGHPDSEFLQGICKWAIATYPNKGDITLIGSVAPNSSGTCILHLYSSSGKDSTTKLPRYCRGQYMSLNGQLFQFGTSNYNWSYERFANLSDITGYYWANIKISSSSNEATTPTFSTIATTGVSYVATLRPSTTETHYLGSANNRWNGVFSKSGNFSGLLTLSVATGTAPFKITSTTVNTNLNADMVDGKHASDFATSGHTHSYLPLSGGTMTGNIKVYTDGDGRGLKFGTSTLNSLGNQLLWQSAEAIRFGSSSWDWDAWAGLKYKHSSKIIYLGLADGTIFKANTALSGGKLYLPGISEVYTGNGTNKVWHAGNDGSGSGLDADTLDGYHIWVGTSGLLPGTKVNNTIYIII